MGPRAHRKIKRDTNKRKCVRGSRAVGQDEGLLTPMFGDTTRIRRRGWSESENPGVTSVGGAMTKCSIKQGKRKNEDHEGTWRK